MTTIAELSPKLGDQVTFTKENFGGSTATIIAIDPNDERTTYLVGWKFGMPGLPLSITCLDPRMPFILNQPKKVEIISNYEGYPYSMWVGNDIIVSIATKSHSSGCKCAGKHCGIFNEWAEPNQADGKTYLCYSCMQRPSCMR